MDWKQYQEEIAQFFRKIGATAETNVTVKGARGTHDIDVYATFNLWGQKCVWICECKFWKSSIPKEKVLTLYQISQDIGADRGFLFSEKGFQSGAIKVTSNTNVTLTSLEEFCESSEEDLFRFSILNFLKKINSFKKLVRELWLDEQYNAGSLKNIPFDEVVLLDGLLLHLSLVTQGAIEGRFPVSFASIDSKIKRCNTFSELLVDLNQELEKIEYKINQFQILADVSKKEIEETRVQFISAVKNLVNEGEEALFHINRTHAESVRVRVVDIMREVGKNAEKLKNLSRGSLKQEVSVIMKLLIDTIYLHLTFETINVDIWEESKLKVFSELENLEQIIIL